MAIKASRQSTTEAIRSDVLFGRQLRLLVAAYGVAADTSAAFEVMEISLEQEQQKGRQLQRTTYTQELEAIAFCNTQDMHTA